MEQASTVKPWLVYITCRRDAPAEGRRRQEIDSDSRLAKKPLSISFEGLIGPVAVLRTMTRRPTSQRSERAMFRSCELLLSQNVTKNAKTEKWLYIKLLDPKPPVIPTNADGETTTKDLYQWMADFGQKGSDFTFWGRWKVGINSVTNSDSDAFSIGNPDLDYPKVWIMSARSQSLDFIERKKKVGKGLTFGDEMSKVALTLYNIRLTNKGIEPAQRGGGLGLARIGSNLFVQGHTISWRPDTSGFLY
jgi:hypothetical protein